jgi:hypothetical protein
LWCSEAERHNAPLNRDDLNVIIGRGSTVIGGVAEAIIGAWEGVWLPPATSILKCITTVDGARVLRDLVLRSSTSAQTRQQLEGLDRSLGMTEVEVVDPPHMDAASGRETPQRGSAHRAQPDDGHISIEFHKPMSEALDPHRT